MQVNNLTSPSFNGFKIHPSGKSFVKTHAKLDDLIQIEDIIKLTKNSKNYDIVLGNGDFYIKNKKENFYTSVPQFANMNRDGNLIFQVKVLKDLFKPNDYQNKIIAINGNKKYIQEANETSNPVKKLLTLFKALEDPQRIMEAQKTEKLRNEILTTYSE